jgi:hypothetical protein
MAYEIVLAPEAVEDLRALKANIRAAVRRAIEIHLRHEPGRRAEVASNACAAFAGRNTGCGSVKLVCFMIFPARVSKSSRS